ncbi:MAG: SPFH domain-containing protein [Lachnospiraceae bacterium]|nr:SPFH domain-containing protein [Lachnospiraceae bacterium]MDY4969669.1 SPFH domain-containing protein [Lachnospiraceae bacterium]
MSSEMDKQTLTNVQEKEIRPLSGVMMLVVVIAGFLVSVAGVAFGVYLAEEKDMTAAGVVLMVSGVILFVVCCILCGGFHVVNPNEALVMTCFGQYYGTIKKEGFYFTNPFAAAFNPAASAGSISLDGKNSVKRNMKVSTKVMTLNNDKQKVNDVLGNPVVIGAVVIWRVQDPTKAVFNVENYKTYLSIQCDTIIRNTARMYPYDNMEENSDSDEMTLRGSSQAIADNMKVELQKRVESAGLEIREVRITHLAYSDEIAAAMLQRQQAVAIIAARQKIVEGAVSMVKMAIDQLGEEEVVVLDEERKAAMVSNLLVVLCGNKDAQPIVNSGSIY